MPIPKMPVDLQSGGVRRTAYDPAHERTLGRADRAFVHGGSRGPGSRGVGTLCAFTDH